jgi:hypothetical protein
MSYYRELAGNRVFRCAECGRRKYVKYVPTSNLCRKCAANKRRKVDNIPVQLKENLIVTKAVERRFTKRAGKEIPLSKAEIIGENIFKWGTLFFWASGYFVARAISDAVFPFEEWTPLFWFVILAWCLGLPWANMVIIDRILAKPKKERADKISARIVELGEERKRKIEEAEQFYSSPEWAMVRKQVIKQKGRVCAECGRKITQNFDITIDHIKPRSRYPDLALKIENLRVLCRSCNSAKGNREFEEY